MRLVRIASDLTERKRSEEVLRRSNEDLKQFAYAASHDLQEPLRMVTSYTQLLDRRYASRLDERAQEYMGFIAHGAARMERLLQGMSAHWQASASKVTSEAMADGQRALGSALLNLQAAVTEAGAVVTHDDLPAVRLPEPLLTQLLQNLVGNAVKYRHPERAPRVHVSANAGGGC